MFRHILTLVLILSLFIVCPLPIKPIKPVTANETWSDTLTFYPSVTIVKENIRNVTNTFSFPLKITVAYASAINISRIKLYQLSANGTTFIQIQNSIVNKQTDSYQPLDIGKTLVFTVYASAKDTVSQNETASVSVTVQAEAVETGGPWYPLIITPEITCTLDASPNVQLSFGQLITNRLNIHYVVSITKKCANPLNITMRAWMTALTDYRVVYYSINTSLFVETEAPLIQAFDILIPISQTPCVLHVAFDYENTTTSELLATINVDSSHVLIQVVIIVGGIVTLAVLVYFGLFRRRKKVFKDTENSDIS